MRYSIQSIVSSSHSLRTCSTPRSFRAYSANAATHNANDEYPEGWEAARPYEEIPGPNRFDLVRWFMPGGTLHGCGALELQHFLHNKYGPIAKFPGMLGQRNAVFTFVPEHFEYVFRNEGIWPMRRNIDTFEYYRKKVRPEKFNGLGGLVSDSGDEWLKLRMAANPVMLSPKTVRSYMSGLDQISRDFVSRIGELRKKQTDEMPVDFDNEISLWALESVGYIGLDRRLGVMTSERSAEADTLIEAIKDSFRLAFELELKPSLWRYIRTRKLQELMDVYDVMAEYITKYIDMALDEKNKNAGDSTANSVLHKLSEKYPLYAFIMTFDMMMAGIDTTSAAIGTMLYRLAISPEKQEILREEIFRLLPEKDTPMTDENFSQFTYFRACVKESMRMQPQVPVNMRAAGKNLILNGYQIPKLSDVIMAHNLLQTSGEYFSESDRFLPERWLRTGGQYADEAKSRNPFVYMPFGFGARACIGRRFVDIEMTTVMARILREYRVEWHHGPMTYENALVIRPSKALQFRMIPI